MAERIISADKSVVFAADVKPEKFEPVVSELAGVEGLGGVKTGFEVALGIGLRTATELVRAANERLVNVYDHQKAGNDIPETGKNFARAMRRAGVDAAILFPFTGPKTQERWTKELQDVGVAVIVGAEMTHEQIRASEQGYVLDAAFMRMYANAIKMGVNNFVVPGNKPDRVAEYKDFFDKEIGEGQYSLWAPGFISQGGDVSETGKVAGPNWHAIVGGAIYNAENVHQAAHDLGQKMLQLNQPSPETQ
ncbi:hypothetical protein A3J32_01265 [Candidatus Saccharibacteria bacterium RIFCSPLOWO2_02_FULL_46_7]|nr:MAG: hypothetical protein A3J32_01265 [Candidatus Saccharibacteria bacterium RIFCSPLOWO2_02_FULL_46_7]